jgi:hypothetical protein
MSAFALIAALCATAQAQAGASTAPTQKWLRAQPGPEPEPQHRVNVPKPTPASGDVAPFVVSPSSTAASAPTVAVIGDSVARDYGYYLARVIGPYARVVDGALGGCPAGALPLIATYRGPHGGSTPLRGGECPSVVPAKQSALVRDFSPRIVVWHSMNEVWDLLTPQGKIAAGSPEWRRRTLRSWDDTLSRVTRQGASVVVVLPLWFEHAAPDPPGGPAPNFDRVRALYTWWAARHREQVTLIDVAPVVCPSGPPCGLVNGVDFRPDTTHFDDAGGMQVATYLAVHVPALLHLIGHRPAG